MGAAVVRGDDLDVLDLLDLRLDLAETLGIWRNATGRVVGIHPSEGEADTVDVEFEGHEILQAYLPAMFRRVN